MNWVSPAWRSSAGGSLRASTKNHWARWAPLVHTLVPVSRQPSATRSARVRTDARSDPLSGSLMPIAKKQRPPAISGRNLLRWGSLP